jgi:hypothetical protein
MMGKRHCYRCKVVDVCSVKHAWSMGIINAKLPLPPLRADKRIGRPAARYAIDDVIFEALADQCSLWEPKEGVKGDV